MEELKASPDYRTATMVFSTESADSVTASKAEHVSTVSDFDDYADAILHGHLFPNQAEVLKTETRPWLTLFRTQT